MATDINKIIPHSFRNQSFLNQGWENNEEGIPILQEAGSAVNHAATAGRLFQPVVDYEIPKITEKLVQVIKNPESVRSIDSKFLRYADPLDFLGIRKHYLNLSEDLAIKYLNTIPLNARERIVKALPLVGKALPLVNNALLGKANALGLGLMLADFGLTKARNYLDTEEGKNFLTKTLPSAYPYQEDPY